MKPQGLWGAALTVSVAVFVSSSCATSTTATPTLSSSLEVASEPTPPSTSDSLSSTTTATRTLPSTTGESHPSKQSSSSTAATVPLPAVEIMGAPSLFDKVIGTLVVDAAAGCVYVESVVYVESLFASGDDELARVPGERVFLTWAEGTRANAEGVTTYLNKVYPLGEFIPNGGLILGYGSIGFAPLDSDTRRVAHGYVDPAFHHCLDSATHVLGPGPVLSACPECTELRPWPGGPRPWWLEPDCSPPSC